MGAPETPSRVPRAVLFLGIAFLGLLALLRLSGRDRSEPRTDRPHPSRQDPTLPEAGPSRPAPAPVIARLLDARSRRAIPGASISIGEGRSARVATSDADGRFVVPGPLHAGAAARVAIHDCGWRSPPLPFTGSEAEPELRVPDLKTVKGRLVAWDRKPLVAPRLQIRGGGFGGVPVPGAAFSLLVDPFHDSLELSGSAEGYASSPPIQVSLGSKEDPAEVELVLGQGGRLHGRVLDSAGAPVPGAWVEALWNGRSAGNGVRASTDAGGNFSYARLTAGPYRLRAGQKGFVDVESGDLSLEEGREAAPVELRLKAGWTLRGKLLSPSGKPVSSGSVFVREGLQNRNAKSDLDGRFEVSGIDPASGEQSRFPGIDSVRAGARGFGTLLRTDVPPDAELVLTLSEEGRLELNVRGAEGPMDPEIAWTASLRARDVPGGGVDAHQGRGRFLRIDALAGGLYDLDVNAPGRALFRQPSVLITPGRPTVLEVVLLPGKSDLPILEFDSGNDEDLKRQLPKLLDGLTEEARESLIPVLRGMIPEGDPRRAALEEVLSRYRR